jgi:hypothetical protein
MAQPFFTENSDAMVALEAMVDKVGIANVLNALSSICYAKGEHISSNWQDVSGAAWWFARAGHIGRLAGQKFMHDAGAPL